MNSQVSVVNKSEKSKQSISSKERVSRILHKYGMLFILIALVILMSVLSPTFFTTGNLLNIVRQMSVVGIVAIGVTIVIITTGIDLSSGSVIALVSVVAASFAHPDTYPVAVPIIIGLGLGLLTGIINGTIISKANIAPFIVTLGMMTAARGAALLFSDGRPIGNLSDSFRFIGQGTVAGIPVPIIIFGFVGLVSYILLNKTKFGKYVYAIGGNEQAAIIAGVNVDKYKILVYAYAGLLSGLAGIILTSRISSGQPTAGMMYELDAIAAAVIGGTSLSGGIGTIGGTIIGALIIGVLNNGLDLLNVSPYWQQILKGVIITVAVFIDSRKNRKS
ncbi:MULTISPECIES: ABC transporter permease [Parageobacillus]|jgi:inositol transport system permease protein|uniref:ABC transporter permease n=1 Tax=Parageobacillus TaxID=1906945 RepID=UPI0009BCA855|nr:MULTISPECIES: sugar ABC transporter permease [Parageobacillus]MED4904826.1 ABC transporter permease [Parageobacillus thermoglucosidasius]MED4913611.1 ABC transporter permease [Parageobacillus thermoglucosidasius]MED4944993.1 ABC transporter permease [Parageobacillus thermoglucosidasius]MED4983398.1 ABC transporter permease [Parageobacillus thermoglucosidasius]BDG47530.1 ribose ABC transporter permease [Parageobacillus sp. KH3-4]